MLDQQKGSRTIIGDIARCRFDIIWFEHLEQVACDRTDLLRLLVTEVAQFHRRNLAIFIFHKNQGADVEGFDVCGKTGSTQIIGRETAEKLGRKVMPHSWFTGFAPRDNPRVVVTVLVEFGGMGGVTAAPLAKALFALYKEKYD